MILFFGPAGAGKSIQGKMLAEAHGWKWISVGQLLRNSSDPEIQETINQGKLVDYKKSSQLVADTIKEYGDIDHIIIDGFPREIEQAKWLVENTPLHERNIALSIILDVPKQELFKRLEARGRKDDEPEAIHERLEVFEHSTMPIINYYKSVGIPVVHVDGTGNVEEVHKRIEQAIEGKVK